MSNSKEFLYHIITSVLTSEWTVDEKADGKKIIIEKDWNYDELVSVIQDYKSAGWIVFWWKTSQEQYLTIENPFWKNPQWKP